MTSIPHDFKLLLCSADVQAALGDAGVASVIESLEAVRAEGGVSNSSLPLGKGAVVWALRRTEPSGRWIGFRKSQFPPLSFKGC